MKPELLILEGVYSYKYSTEIDFSTLCAADLFGIFGNVGSGKSAILEAVTYVLYGKIERLSNRVYYNMMNLASNRMFIDFTFTNRENTYRFTFETKRNKKDFEKIETPRRSAYVMRDAEWIPLFDKDGQVSAEEIIGLSYDNFRRTIIVPQGRFQEFLHLEKSKRTEMLMELFGLNRFDLFSKTSFIAHRNNEKMALVEGELSGLSDASEESVEETEKEVALLKKEMQQNSVRLKQSEELLKKHEGLADLSKQIRAASANLELKMVLEADYVNRRASLELYEECFSKFKSALDILSILERDLGAEHNKQRDVEQRLKAGRLNLASAEDKFREIESEYLELERYEKESSWYESLADIRKFSFESVRLQAELDSRRSDLSEVMTAKAQISGRMDQIRESLKVEINSNLTTDEINSLNLLYRAFSDLSDAKKSSQNQLEELRAELISMDERLAAYRGLKDEEADLLARDDAFRKVQLKDEIQKELSRLSAHLEEGKACPVCGSLEHPSPASGSAEVDDSILNEAAKISECREELERRSSELQKLENERAAIYGRIKSAGEQVQRLENDETRLRSEFPRGGFGPADRAVFDAEAERLNAERTMREQLQAESADLAVEQEKINDRITQINEGESRIRLELAGLEAKIENIESKIDPCFIDDNLEAGEVELRQLSKILRDKIINLKDNFKKAEIEVNNAAVQNEKNLTEFDILKNRIKELQEGKTRAETDLNNLLSGSEYSDINEVKTILEKKIDTAAERAAVESFERELNNLKLEIKSLNNRMKGEAFDETAYADSLETSRVLKDKQEEIITRLGELGNILKAFKSRLERKIFLQAEADALRIRGENLSVLRNLFKGKKFIDYAATIYLRELCEAANVRFRKLTRESLRLELDETNNFIIRDYLNEGKVRSVKTLSGGQTFQAAFSLSLALADSIGRERSGFFFLDEGFGSLDRESLALVFDSLKTLKKEHRTVGIISHVEELKQEIDTFITIKKDNEEGSIIKNSWN